MIIPHQMFFIGDGQIRSHGSVPSSVGIHCFIERTGQTSRVFGIATWLAEQGIDQGSKAA
ncbi:hypothetical protein [Thiocystis violacea]|uniref:hypothetical protein n=1 Tax=Thiocystis violacea TaxID=13725 RepID=UPI00190718E1|nr:hypothetical protein [Thiocystis violacea]